MVTSIQEATYKVRLVITFDTVVYFAPIEREGVLNHLDAIDNAVSQMPIETWDDILDGFGGEFKTSVQYTVEEL